MINSQHMMFGRINKKETFVFSWESHFLLEFLPAQASLVCFLESCHYDLNMRPFLPNH